ncbi:hypothetical protein C8034_v000547 [Colletotrichum sidae]|uniref:Uncharacterized protein n=1 Tax=Colletotrichum sidae TaxID=1347389 RepID=A0A4R8TG25_9PEZI|nr:hypothetical protein C8034_v000547 [Colletotrichum sidae]
MTSCSHRVHTTGRGCFARELRRERRLQLDQGQQPELQKRQSQRLEIYQPERPLASVQVSGRLWQSRLRFLHICSIGRRSSQRARGARRLWRSRETRKRRRQVGKTA